MKKFLTILLIVLLLLSGIITTQAATETTVTLQFQDLAAIAKERNGSMQALRKQAEALKDFDLFDEGQRKLFNASAALQSGQEQLNAAIGQGAEESPDASAIALLQESIRANTSALQGLMHSMAYALEGTDDYGYLMQHYANEAADQAASGSETLFLTYNYLNYLQQNLERQQQYLENALTVAQVSYEQGMITYAQLLERQQNQEALKNGIADTEELKQVVLGNLKQLLGYSSSTNLRLGDLPAYDFNNSANIDYASDIKTACKNNHTIKEKNQEMNIARDDANNNSSTARNIYNAADITLSEAKKQFDIDFKSVYNNLLKQKRSLSLQIHKSDVQRENLRVATMQYQAGLLSGMDLQAAQDAADSQFFSEMQSKISYLEALQTYQWAVKGLLNSSLDTIQQNSQG